MADYALAYGGEKIDQLLGFVDKLTVTAEELNGVYDTIDNLRYEVDTNSKNANNMHDSIQNKIDNVVRDVAVESERIEGLIKGVDAKASSSSVSSLTRHYKLNNSIDIPWDSGTLVCDMNDTGTMFRLHGNTYKSSANDAWSKTEWIPGTNETWAGYKTFKVKAPSDGKVRWIDCSGIHINTNGSVYAGNFNYDHICIGTDGYIYVCTMKSKPNNTNPLITFYFGIVCHVDSESHSGEVILGDASDFVLEEEYLDDNPFEEDIQPAQ